MNVARTTCAGLGLLGMLSLYPAFADPDVDTDSDGLFDSWEFAHGLNPNSPAGDDGAFGDPDSDGLSNRAEYQAFAATGIDLHPHHADTLGAGLPDFFQWTNTGSNRFGIVGEIFSDYDGIPDLWETNHALNPNVYDSQVDSDSDGWPNRTEFLGHSDPQNNTSTPLQEMAFLFSYTGTQTNGPTRVFLYHSAAMDGPPYGFAPYFARHGPAWFHAFIDTNTNGVWNSGEAAGLARTQPQSLSWDALDPIEIDLTDSQPIAAQPNYALPGYGRFAWAAIPGATGYKVVIRNRSLAGSPVVLDRTVTAPRTWFHEGDYRHAGISGMAQATYEWFAYHTISNVDFLVTSGVFAVTYPALTTPTLVTPDSNVFTRATADFEWSGSSGATMFQFQLATNAAFTSPLLNTNLFAPIPDATGRYRYRLPILAGDARLPPGTYRWRVRASNPQGVSAFTAARTCTFDLTDQPAGPFSVAGTLSYFGRATNGHFVAQAFTGPGFGSAPLAQISFTNTAALADGVRHDFPYRLAGLPAGTVFVRGFLDQDGDRQFDNWESAGFVTTNGYVPSPLNFGASITNQLLALVPADTDSDRLPDDWEFQFFTNLTTALLGTNAYTDSNGDGLDDFDTYAHAPPGTHPRDPDAAGEDQVPYRIKTAFTLPPLEDVTFRFSGAIGTTGNQHAVMWGALPGGTVAYGAGGHASQSNHGVVVNYQVECSTNLVAWTDVNGGHTDYTASSNALTFSAPATNGAYRLRISW